VLLEHPWLLKQRESAAGEVVVLVRMLLLH
jgi:hypothetical protein